MRHRVFGMDALLETGVMVIEKRWGGVFWGGGGIADVDTSSRAVRGHLDAQIPSNTGMVIQIAMKKGILGGLKPDSYNLMTSVIDGFPCRL